MEDPKSSVSDLTPWSDQGEASIDPATQPERPTNGPESTQGAAPGSAPGFVTDNEAFELLAAGMTDASDAVAGSMADVGERSGTGGDDDAGQDGGLDGTAEGTEPRPVRTGFGRGDVDVGADGGHFDRRTPADQATTDQATTDESGTVESGTVESDTGGSMSGESVSVESVSVESVTNVGDLPPLVVIPDEKRNHRRNRSGRSVRPVRSEPALVPVDDHMTVVGWEDAQGPPMGDEIDDDAVADCAMGDGDDIGRLYERYAGPVTAVAATMLSDRAAIDDALYETFSVAWRAASSFEAAGPKGPWLFTLARRCAEGRLGSLGGQGGEGASEIYPAPSHRGDSVGGVDEVWEAWEIRLALEQLPRSDRSVLHLVHSRGLIHQEIASELAIPLGTVKSRAYAGSRRLVELLDHVIRPQAGRPADDDMASALTWYLSGLADGSELSDYERRAIKRIQRQLASEPAWIQPAPWVRSKVVQLAGADAMPSSGYRDTPAGPDRTGLSPTGSTAHTTMRYDMSEAEELFYARQHHVLRAEVDGAADGEERWAGSQGRVPVLLAAVAVVLSALALMAWRSMSDSTGESTSGVDQAGVEVVTGLPEGEDPTLTGPSVAESDDVDPTSIGSGVDQDAVGGAEQESGGSSDTTLVYELMATDVDPDAKAIVLVTPTSAGADFELQIQALEPTAGDQYLAAWLVNGDQWGRSGGSGGQAGASAPNGDAAQSADSTDDADLPLAVPLVSFEWGGDGGVFRFPSAAVDDRFDTIVITRQRPDDPIGPSGPVVFFGSLGS